MLHIFLHIQSGKERESSPSEKRLRASSKNAVSGSGTSTSRNSSSRALEDREARKERKLGRKRVFYYYNV